MPGDKYEYIIRVTINNIQVTKVLHIIIIYYMMNRCAQYINFDRAGAYKRS
jgi:hypothetical protein